MEGNINQQKIKEYIRFRNELRQSKEKIDEALKEIFDAVSSEYIKRTKKSIGAENLEVYFGPEIYADIALAVKLSRQYFFELGIDKVHFGKLFVFHKDEQEFNDEGGLSAGVSVVEPNILGNINLKRLVFLKKFVHELYHTTAVVGHTIKNGDEIVSQDNLGASYLTDETCDGGSLLEEGLASLFEDRMFKEICEQFNAKTVSLYHRLTSHALKRSKTFREQMNGDIGRVIINEFDMAEPRFLWGGSTYAYAAEVTRLLEQTIPGFRHLVERARVYRETLALSRAMELYFGKGSYRLITSATPSEAKDLLAKLMVLRHHD